MKRKPSKDPEPDLLTLLAEQEDGPPACPHASAGRKEGFVQDLAPGSPYYAEWVHASPTCRRSPIPGLKQPVPTMGWSRELQKDVPL